MNILLLQLKRIGDLILTTPAIRCLREAFPQARLILVIDSPGAGLREGLPVDECWVHHKGAGLGPNGWIKRLPACGAEWCLDFTGNDRSALFTALSFAKRRVTFERFRKKPFRRFVYTDFVESPVRLRHTGDHYTDLLRPLGIERENVPPDLSVPGGSVTQGRSLLAEAGVTGAYAVIHAGTARAEKYWVPERWAEVIAHLRAGHGLPCVLTGSSEPAEREHLRAIAQALPGGVADISGRGSLLDLAAIIRGARIFCGVDTAAMHLADAMGTPCVALFGPTNAFHWRPRFTPSVTLRADTDVPFEPGQPGGPMEHLAVKSVKAAVDSLLR